MWGYTNNYHGRILGLHLGNLGLHEGVVSCVEGEERKILLFNFEIINTLKYLAQ